jgi:transposase InsO family protein
MKIEEIITAARSPWQNAYMERLIDSIRRECLDHSDCSGRKSSAPNFEKLLRLLTSIKSAFILV